MEDLLNEDVIYWLRIMLDFTVVTYLVYVAFRFSQNTKVLSILKGAFFVLFLWLVSSLLGLNVLKFILSNILLYGTFVLLIIFQPEIRSALESLGKRSLLSIGLNKGNLFGIKTSSNEAVYKLKKEEINDIVESLDYMSNRKIGALICIEIDDSLNEYIETGISLNAKISKELLINIFTINAPLHDGALIIKNGRIESGSCVLPLSDSSEISKDLGTRHRAAIGVSEKEDVLTLIVSEETGFVSITRNGKLYRGLEKKEYRRMIEMLLCQESEVKVEDNNNDDEKRINLFKKIRLKK